MLDDAECATIYSALLAMMRYRGWTPNATASVISTATGAFRFFADGPGVRVVALFVRPALSLPALRDAIDVAKATHPPTSTERLVVLALHSGAAIATPATTAFVTALADAPQSALSVELWHTRLQLGIDVMRHVDVGPHHLANADERARYPASVLWLIRRDDPVARWLGARVGDVVVEEHVSGVPNLRRVVR